MQKVAALIVTIAFVLTSLSVFVTKVEAAQAQTAKEKTLFQAVRDSIEEASQARAKKTWEDPIQKTYPIFEEVKANLDTLNEKSAKAKTLSLREKKEEVLKRRASNIK